MTILNLYTTPTCPFCNRLKKLLDAQKIKYVDHNVEKREYGAVVIERNGHIPVPQVEFEGSGRIIYNYSTEEALVDEIVHTLKKK